MTPSRRRSPAPRIARLARRHVLGGAAAASPSSDEAQDLLALFRVTLTLVLALLLVALGLLLALFFVALALLLAFLLVAPALLSRASSEGSEVHHETSTRLLEMASADPAAFRGVVAAMTEGQKAFMEEVIKSGRANSDGNNKTAAGTSGQPSIALKMDFGS